MIRLAIAFVVLNSLDMSMTLLCVGNGYSELNPIMKFIVTQPLYLVILFKVGLSAVFAVALVLLRLKAVLCIVVSATLLICIWNAVMLIRG